MLRHNATMAQHAMIDNHTVFFMDGSGVYDQSGRSDINFRDGGIFVTNEMTWNGQPTLRINGSGYVKLSKLDYFQAGKDFTVDAWIYNTSNQYGAIFSQANYEDASYGLLILHDTASNTSGSYPRCWLSSNNSSWNYWSGGECNAGEINVNKWTHVAIVKQGSRWYFYWNGKLAAIPDFGQTIIFQNPTDKPNLFRYNNDRFTGYCAQYRISDCARWLPKNLTTGLQQVFDPPYYPKQLVYTK